MPATSILQDSAWAFDLGRASEVSAVSADAVLLFVALELPLPPHEGGGEPGHGQQPAAATGHRAMLRVRVPKVELPRGRVERRPGWWNGRYGGLKILCSQGRAGSNPAPGTEGAVIGENGRTRRFHRCD